MSDLESTAASFLPLSELAFQIMVALGNGTSHGYAIGKEIEERTEGRLNPTTGSLYQALRRMREDGLIAEVDGPAEKADTRRRYFALSPVGRRTMALEVDRLESLISVARDRALAPRRS